MRRRPVRLLVVGRSEADAGLALDVLQAAGFDPFPRRVDDAAALRRALAEDARLWDALLADLETPEEHALEVVAAFREVVPDAPVLFIAGAVGEEAAVAAMRAGASDVVTRSRLARLAPALEQALADAAGRARVRDDRAALAEARDRYLDLYESAPVGYLTLSAEGRVLQANQTAHELLGHAGDALAGAPFQKLVLRSDADRWQQHLARALGGDERCRVELRLRAGHGALVHVQADSVRRVVAGEPASVRVALTDISDRKEAEAALRRFEAKLREVQKMESLGTLAGGIAHDFNNILAAILGNVELARDDLPAAHRALSSLDEIRKAGLRARDLVNQILMFSRREPQELVTQPLQPVMAETQRLLRATLPARVALSFDVPEEPLHVQTDATQFQQVLMNLCTNAWHALKDGTGHIVVRLRPQALEAGEARRLGLDGPGDYAHVEVTDDGQGMDALTLARIFEPFFTTKPVGQGTGLGLSVVHGILAAHHGAVDVDSTPGAGTTFHLWFPLSEPPAPIALPASDADAGASAAVPARPGHGERVVYIDDDETMAVMVERLLERAGYQVRCYTDPAVALAVLCARDAPVDCVVTDFNMPEVSGLDVARELRRSRPEVPVVMSTGFLSDELRSDARQLGIRALLQKQNTVQELADLVGAVMAGTVTG